MFRSGNTNNIFSAIFLTSLLIVAVGHYFSIINISALLESLPGWFIFALGICTTIFVQKKLLNQPTISESTVAIRDLELLRNDPTRLTKLKKYTGEKNVPFTADEFRRWMKLVTEFTIDYYEHPEVYDVITS
uniref:Uncharacterized protein n=1 Tax=Panagrolaimus sp. ES5 TaxID=591445 RepID=A0AC34GB23_9BILA